jgi:soluble lytic murein transglycosylase
MKWCNPLLKKIKNKTRFLFYLSLFWWLQGYHLLFSQETTIDQVLKYIETYKTSIQSKEFEDFNKYLKVKKDFKKAQDCYKNKNFDCSLKLLKIINETINSSLNQTSIVSVQKDLKILSAQITMLEASVYFKKKESQKSFDLFLLGFEQLNSLKLLPTVKEGQCLAFVNLCEKYATDSCIDFERKILKFFTKKNIQKSKSCAYLIEKHLKNKPEKPKTKIDEQILVSFKNEQDSKSQIKPKIKSDFEIFEDGFRAYLNQNYEEAFKTLEDILILYPDTQIKLKTMFWLGRIAQKLNKNNVAETFYRKVMKEIPFAYYSLLSSWYSGIDLQRVISASLPVVNVELKNFSEEELLRIKRASTFIANGYYDFAALELSGIKLNSKNTIEEINFLVAINFFAKNYITAFQYLSELTKRGYYGFFSTYGKKIVFPLVYFDEIKKVSKQYQFDSYLVLSLIKQESAFYKNAISNSLAYGLMQLIPQTARDLNESIELSDLFEPKINIDLGVRYLVQLMNRFDKNVIWVLAGYNAGPFNADRWINKSLEYKNLNYEEMIELISFRETHDYVQNILRNYYWYNRIYEDRIYGNLKELVDSFKIYNKKIKH